MDGQSASTSPRASGATVVVPGGSARDAPGQIAGGSSTYAMWAIVALGMAQMLRTSVLVRSAEAPVGEPIMARCPSAAPASHQILAATGTHPPQRLRTASRCNRTGT